MSPAPRSEGPMGAKTSRDASEYHQQVATSERPDELRTKVYG
jgi:hypothetical protein